MKTIQVILLLISFLLLGGWSANSALFAQETSLSMELVDVGSNQDSVEVAFTLRLQPLKEYENLTDAGIIPYYQIFVNYGDVTYNIFKVYDEWAANSPKPLPIVGTRVNGMLEFKFTHFFNARPTQEILVSTAAIKTTDTRPPPARFVVVDIDALISNPPNNLAGEVEKVVEALANLTTADQLTLITAAAASSTSTANNEAVTLSFSPAPVSEDRYVGVLELRNQDTAPVSGSIYLYYNLDSYAPTAQAQDSVLTVDSVFWWKQTTQLSFNPNANIGKPFTKRLKINFANLQPAEIRRFILPFYCPQNLTADGLNDAAISFAVAVKSNALAAFESATDNLEELHTVTTEEQLPVAGKPGVWKLTVNERGGISVDQQSQPTSGPEQVKAVAYTVKAEPSTALQTVLTNLGQNQIGSAKTTDLVRNGHDPNSITVAPDCLPWDPQIVTMLVDVQNFGSGPALAVDVFVENVPSITGKRDLLVSDHSFGSTAQLNTKVEYDPSRDGYLITITDIYLPGVLELALDAGFEVIGQDVDTLIAELKQAEFDPLTRAYLVLRVKSPGYFGQPEEEIVNGEIIFDNNDPVPMADTISRCRTSCGSTLLGPRIGYNVPLSFADYSTAFDLEGNYTFGLFFHHQPCRGRWAYSAELNANRWQYADNDVDLQHTQVEVNAALRYRLSRSLSVGLGPSYVSSATWERSDQGALGFSFDQDYWGGFLDLNLSKARFGGGIRGAYYRSPLSLTANGESQSLTNIQLYVFANLVALNR